MKWTTISVIIGTILIVVALTMKLIGVEIKLVEPIPDSDITIELSEPNEPEAKIVYLGYSLENSLPPYIVVEPEPAKSWSEALVRWPDAVGYITDNFGNTVPMNESFLTYTAEIESEPDEPESIEVDLTDVIIKICNKCPPTPNDDKLHFCPGHIQISDFIPTWPDYIELEKELVIGHSKFVNPNGSIGDHYDIVLEKGTKIYFKDD